MQDIALIVGEFAGSQQGLGRDDNPACGVAAKPALFFDQNGRKAADGRLDTRPMCDTGALVLQGRQIQLDGGAGELIRMKAVALSWLSREPGEELADGADIRIAGGWRFAAQRAA